MRCAQVASLLRSITCFSGGAQQPVQVTATALHRWQGPCIVRQWTPSDVKAWLGLRGVPAPIVLELFALEVGGLALMSLHYAAGRGGAHGLSTCQWRKCQVQVENLEPDARAFVAGACELLERSEWVLDRDVSSTY